MLTMLDEFAGIGGATIAGDWLGIQTTQFVEIDPDAQRVLRHYHPNTPIHDDIRTYHPRPREHDIHWNSFPCTGTSSAGSRTGLNHAESGLWLEALRCIIEGRPNFVVIENPEGLIHRGLREVLGGLRMAGYTWDDPQLISAAWLGAPHQRNRLFIVAYPNELRRRFRHPPTCWNQQIRADIEAIANGYGKPSYSSGYEQRREPIGALSSSHPSSARWERANGDAERITERSDPGILDRDGQDESKSSWVDDGVPAWLRGRDFDGWWRNNHPPRYPGISNRTPGRRACIKLYGRAVMPQQAAIALRRVLYLNSILGD